MTQQSLDFEFSSMSGFAMAQNDKYRRRRMAEREREMRNLANRLATNSSGANEAGWQQLARVFGKGGGSVQRGGERLVN